MIEAKRPIVVVVKKETSECLFVDIAVPGDMRAERKEDEKVEKYIDLLQGARKTVGSSMLFDASSYCSSWNASQEAPLLSGITRHQSVFGGTTEGGDLTDSSDIENGAIASGVLRL